MREIDRGIHDRVAVSTLAAAAVLLAGVGAVIHLARRSRAPLAPITRVTEAVAGGRRRVCRALVASAATSSGTRPARCDESRGELAVDRAR